MNILHTISRRKDNCIGKILPSRTFERKIEAKSDGKTMIVVSSYWVARRKREERRSTISHSGENSLWKGLRSCRKTDYAMNECMKSSSAVLAVSG